MPALAVAQDARATLGGCVSDPQAGPIAQATVTLLAPGACTLSVTAASFATQSPRTLEVRVGQTRRADVTLAVAGVATSITVAEPPPTAARMTRYQLPL